MKEHIRTLLKESYDRAVQDGVFNPIPDLSIPVETPKEPRFGDFSTNLAMFLSKRVGMPPRAVAQHLADRLDNRNIIDKWEIAGPGFLNLFIQRDYWLSLLNSVVVQGERFGSSDFGKQEKVLLEYVSANPTGPLHVGHGRIAVVGDVLARVLRFAGFSVFREYYINDVGLQMDLLAQSTYSRYEALVGKSVPFPENGYQGEYLVEIAKDIRAKEGDRLSGLPEADVRERCGRFALDSILDLIREDLDRFGVRFDQWYSEKTLYEKGEVEAVLRRLTEKGFLYEKDDALWFRTDSSEDEKDRVVRRGSGQYTYFASDIAYHEDKFHRGFSRFIDVWGSDHHGYVPRIKSVLRALDRDPGNLQVILVQFVNLKRGGEIVSMSTRKGTFTELSEVIGEVGVDATRFFFLTRSSDSHLDFDLDLAKSTSTENPVYYVQYAHARICSIFKTAEEKKAPVPSPGSAALHRLVLDEEMEMIKQVLGFPDWVEVCADKLQPHHLTHYVWELSGMFHRYYNKHRVVSDDPGLTGARLFLVRSIQTVIQNALGLLGVSAPESM